jgi:hypothetical protein
VRCASVWSDSIFGKSHSYGTEEKMWLDPFVGAALKYFITDAVYRLLWPHFKIPQLQWIN